MRFKEELGQIFWFPQNRISHFYFIRRMDGDFDLVDTSVFFERAKIDYFLREQKKGLKRLVLTHGHPDHAGNAQYVTDKYHCEVFAHPKELPFLKGIASMKVRDYTGINLFGRLIQFGDMIIGQPICKGSLAYDSSSDLLNDYDFFPLHGHTTGSTGVFHKTSRSLFLGDALVNNSAIEFKPVKGLKLPYRYFAEDYDMAIASLSTLHHLDFDNAFFGHGDPLIGNAKEVIVDFLNKEGIRP